MRPAEDHDLFFLGASKRDVEHCRTFFSQGILLAYCSTDKNKPKHARPYDCTGVRNSQNQVSLQGTAQLVITLLQELSEELAGYRHYEKFIRLIERLQHRGAPTVRSPSAVSPRRMTAYVAKVLWEELPEPNKGTCGCLCQSLVILPRIHPLLLGPP